MERYAIALDLGTSGFRAQSINLHTHEIISTCITTRNPLPGLNSIDQLHFALEYGVKTAQNIVTCAINRIIKEFGIPENSIDRIAVCGNPVQLSIFEGKDIFDLAFTGSRKAEMLTIKNQNRDAHIASASVFPGLCLSGSCEVVVPPAISQQVGADTIALIMQSGMTQKKETSIAIDFGTNAEIALYHNGIIYTASAAAGPAIEGQQISCGMLAAPGAIADITPTSQGYQLLILDAKLNLCNGLHVNLIKKSAFEKNCAVPKGITGTGIIALISEAIDQGLITLPNINTISRALHIGPKMTLSEEDLKEAGKAFGAIRAGYFTLCQEAGVNPEDICSVYMSGASGTYVDASKAQRLGLIPPCVKNIYQIGNTSLAQAKELAIQPDKLDMMSSLAFDLKKSHCMLAGSETFKKVYILELSYWGEGLPMKKYREFLKRYKYRDLPPVKPVEVIHKISKRDITDLGNRGLTVLSDVGKVLIQHIHGCKFCMICEEICPGKAIRVFREQAQLSVGLNASLCIGLACRKCERHCPEKVFHLDAFFGQMKRKT